MKTLLIAAVMAAFTVTAQTTMATPPSDGEWKTISQALEQAPKENKMILLDVYTDWCGWCKRMDRDTYADSAVKAYLAERYIPSKMNPEKEGKVKYDGKEYTQGEFGQALGIHGYPATAFFNEKGEVLTVVSGYVKADEFLRILKYFGDGIYKTKKWEEYTNATTAK